MTIDPRQLLLALCDVPDVSWALLAREAQKRGPGGLEPLVAGEISEASSEADRTRAALMSCTTSLDERLERAQRATEEASAVGARLTTVLDDTYPANLRLIHNLPPFLFYRGQLERDDVRSVAIVGTREASADGLRRARQLARGLVAAGVTVVSGLARGIDTEAHRATLEHGGRTVAVVGTGILRTYPPENRELADAIADAGGAIVSQFWPGQGPARHTFPRRNVVTSGIGQGTVVVEASSTSGAKMQARLAIEHHKRVFLLHHLVTRQPWARSYLDRGAVEVHSVDEVLELLQSVDHIERVAASRRQLTLDVV